MLNLILAVIVEAARDAEKEDFHQRSLLQETGLFLSLFEGFPGSPWKSQKEGQEDHF